MTADRDRAVGTYLLPWAEEVNVTAPMGRHGPELHLTLPGQRPIKLVPVTPRRWRVPGLTGTEIAFEVPGRMDLSQYGRHIDALRAE